MHIRLMKMLSEFFEQTARDLDQLTSNAGFSAESARDNASGVSAALGDVAGFAGSFNRALSLYASDPLTGSPEQLRSATTNLVRAIESFKVHFVRLYPHAGVRNHPFVGCLYGYAQPRTATLDKAALVAQETMIDIWSLSKHELDALAASTRHDYQTMTQAIGEIKRVVEQVQFTEVA